MLVSCDGRQGRGGGSSFILYLPHTQLLRKVTLPHLFLDISSRLRNTGLCPVCPGPVLSPQKKRESLKLETRWAGARRLQAGTTASRRDLVLGLAPLASENISSGSFLSCERGDSPKVKERFPDQEGWVWVPAPALICRVILEDFLPHSEPLFNG